MRPSATADIQIEQPDVEGLRLLAALDGERTREGLEAEVGGEEGGGLRPATAGGEVGRGWGGEEVGDLRARLGGVGVVEDAADEDLIADEVIARFDRQLRYFSDISSGGPTPSQSQGSLESARIAVLGVGGFGGWSALSLSCCGIGEMLLVDFGRVELTNLTRQVLYGEDDIGRNKAEAAAERLRSFNSRMRLEVLPKRLESQAEIAATIEGYDLVIDAIDWPTDDVERWVNSACFKVGVPYIAMSHFPPAARVGPLYVPGVTGCFACQEISYRRAYPLFDVAMEQRRAKSSPGATLGPACALIGGQAALDIMHYLTRLATPSTLGVGHNYDLRTMSIEREEVVPEPECPVCSHLQSKRDNGTQRTARRPS